MGFLGCRLNDTIRIIVPNRHGVFLTATVPTSNDWVKAMFLDKRLNGYRITKKGGSTRILLANYEVLSHYKPLLEEYRDEFLASVDSLTPDKRMQITNFVNFWTKAPIFSQRFGADWSEQVDKWLIENEWVPEE